MSVAIPSEWGELKEIVCVSACANKSPMIPVVCFHFIMSSMNHIESQFLKNNTICLVTSLRVGDLNCNSFVLIGVGWLVSERVGTKE